MDGAPVFNLVRECLPLAGLRAVRGVFTSTATVVLGPTEGIRWLATRDGYCGMGITRDQAVIVTPGFDRFRIPTEEARARAE